MTPQKPRVSNPEKPPPPPSSLLTRDDGAEEVADEVSADGYCFVI
jgi:hypothetical protein